MLYPRGTGAFRSLVAAWAILLVLAAVSYLGAQTTTATIRGTVKDASGSVVPGATITAHNLENNLLRTRVSGGDGTYSFDNLPV